MCLRRQYLFPRNSCIRQEAQTDRFHTVFYIKSTNKTANRIKFMVQ